MHCSKNNQTWKRSTQKNLIEFALATTTKKEFQWGKFALIFDVKFNLLKLQNYSNLIHIAAVLLFHADVIHTENHCRALKILSKQWKSIINEAKPLITVLNE